jgi:hypothetical protein
MQKKNFLIDIKLLDSFTTEFFSLIPKQRKIINNLMNEGLILSYSLAIDRSKLWIVMETENEQEVLDALSRFPLIKFMIPEITELAFHDSIHSGFPQLSLN